MSEISGISTHLKRVKERVLGPSLEEQFTRVVHLPQEACHYVEVPGLLGENVTNASSGWGISSQPISVSSIRNCCNVNLIGNVFSAATHYNPIRKDVPEEYLPIVIEALKSKGESNFFATVVGGDKEHFERILRVLKSQKIPIVGKFRDEPNENGRWLNKDVVIIPGTRRVILRLRGPFQESYKKLS